MGRFLSLPQRAPRATLTVIALLTLFFGSFAVSLRFDRSADNLLPVGDPERSYYEEVRKEFGSEEITVIGLFAEDVFAPATVAKIDALTKKLATLEGVREVVSLTTVQAVEITDLGLRVGPVLRKVPQTLEEAAALRAQVMANPLYVKNVVSADGRAAGISVFFDAMSDEEFTRLGLEDRIRAMVDEARGPEELEVTGVPTLKVFGARELKGDLLKFLPLSAVIVTMVLAWTFRTLRGVLIPLSTVGVGIVWTAGLMVMTDTPINLGTVILPPLLMAVGVAYAIHMMARYYQEIEVGRSVDDIITSTMEHVRLPVFVAALTTLAGFITFTFMPIRAIREFGIFSSFGLTATLIGAFTILPAVLMTTNVITIWDLVYLKLGPEPHKQIPLFHGLNSIQAKIVVLMGRLANAASSSLITRQGEVKAEMYVLLSGRAEVRRGGSTRNLRTLARGDVIGEMGLVRKQPRSADVVAVGDVEYLVLDEKFLHRIRSRYPRIGNAVLYNLTRILSDRLDTTRGRLAAAPAAAAAVPAE